MNTFILSPPQPLFRLPRLTLEFQEQLLAFAKPKRLPERCSAREGV